MGESFLAEWNVHVIFGEVKLKKIPSVDTLKRCAISQVFRKNK